MSGKVAYSVPASDVLGQLISPLTFLTNLTGQYGLVNIRYGASSEPEIERAIIENVAGYGKQLGRLLEAVEEIAKHLEKKDPSIGKIDAIKQLHELACEIKVTKEMAVGSSSMPLSEFIDGLERLKSTCPQTFDNVREKLKALL